MPFRIICFNHHMELLKLYSANLTMRGFEVFTFRENMRSFTQIEQHHPDIVILGDFGGIGSEDMQLLTKLRENPQYNDLPLIIATTTPLQQLEGIDQLANIYMINKPFDINLLVNTVNLALRGKLKPA
ncbi:MAG: response regulator transcription factor [Anaerolineae bacterium]|nr:response regulator transcription factor [Anaerolineae bacterium]